MKVKLLVLLAVMTSFQAKAIDLPMFSDTSVDMNDFSLIAQHDFEIQPFGLSNKSQELKVEALTRQIAQQKQAYEDKISYLQTELERANKRIVEKTVLQAKLERQLQKSFIDEKKTLKREIVAKNKTIMEYQRLLEKVRPGKEVKELLETNTELAIELRRVNDQLAHAELQYKEKNEAIATKEGPASGRFPASKSEQK